MSSAQNSDDHGTPLVKPEFAKLSRDNLKDRIAGAIRNEILSGRMAPGTVYKMGELAAQFGASRTPMREAILELESKRLVEITKGVGFRVSTPSLDELRDNLEIRELLEGSAAARIAGKLDSTEIEKARAMVREIHDAAVVNDLAGYLERDRQFHVYLVGLTGNQRMTSLVEDLRDAQRVPGLARVSRENHLTARNQEHVALLDAIEKGDAEVAESVVKSHLQLSRLAFEPQGHRQY